MCPGSKNTLCSTGSVMEGCEFKKQDGVFNRFSVLLELSASDVLIGFRTAVEEEGYDVDGSSLWYGRRIGSKKMGFEERTPLMIASMFGSKQVINYILQTGCVDVNKACGSDGATALHCAVAGVSPSSPEVVKLLLDASADVNCVDANGNRPVDLVAPVLNSPLNSKRKMLEMMLNGYSAIGEEFLLTDQKEKETSTPPTPTEKREYPVDLSLPDIKTGVYGTDEFRMYAFKIKPCSRAYSHDWTECPFVHPGENARRRDPRKFHYSCVPCPEFRKGTCRQGDACEYAHGIFECWLHPAQYRTRLCKDEVGCSRKVCFFAHKSEELRPLYASTGSAVLSPRSFSAGNPLDMSISPIALGSTPPMTPLVSSPMGGSMWLNQPNPAPPTLNLSSSRLKSTLSARDIDLDVDLHRRHQQQLMDEISGVSSPSGWNNNTGFADWNGEPKRSTGVNPTNLDDLYGSLDPSILYQLQGQQSPTGIQIRHNINQQLRSSYSSNLSSSPVRASPSFGFDQAGATAAVLTSRSAAFAKRSQSFIDRSAVNHQSGISSSPLSDWGSPDGKLDWGIQKDELNKLRKSASFGFRNNGSSFATPGGSELTAREPEFSWAPSMVKNVQPENNGHLNFDEQQHAQYNLNSGGSEMLSQWVEQLYMEQEQLVV